MIPSLGLLGLIGNFLPVSMKILGIIGQHPSVSNPTGYMLRYFGFPLLIWCIFHRFFQNDESFSWSLEFQLVIILKLNSFICNNTDHPNQLVLLFGVTQCNNVLLKSLIFTNESWIGCSDIVKHKWLGMVKYYILNK